MDKRLPIANLLPPMWAWALSLILVFPQSHAAPAGIIPPNPEQQGLPLNWRIAPVPQRTPQEAAAGPAIADQELPSAIKQIELHAPRFADEIRALLRPFIGQTRISGQALEQARGRIWSLYRQHGTLAQIEIAAVGQNAEQGGSLLRVSVREIRVHVVRVEQEGAAAVSPAVLADILAGAKAELAEGGVFNVDSLDSRLKRRLFLGDVNLHAILVPVGDDTIDVNLQVSAIAADGATAPEWVAQYDDYGMRSYGRNRTTGGVALPAVITPGDRVNLLATASSGMDYGRAAYELPLIGWGARLAVWTSYVDYRAPTGEAGTVAQFGLGLSAPLYFGNAATWTGYLDYVDSRQRDHVGEDLAVDDKRADSLQGRIEANFLLGPAQSAHLSLALMQGRLDLSALPSALAQDQQSARSNGAFTKFNWEVAWSDAFGEGARFDTRAEIKGQAANKNLDESEKFTLGGPGGVRAYGSSEAMGDEGAMLNTELGYRPLPALRLYGLYDLGHIRLVRDPWMAGPTPPSYTLRGAGLGASYAWRMLSGSLVYARQLGGNPGLGANGLDAEGLNDRYRLWLTLAAQF